MNIIIISGIACFILAPFVGMLASKFSIVSGSVTTRWSKAPKPLLGGISMLLAIIAAQIFGEIPLADHPILISVILFTAIGIIDDIFDLSPGKKLTLQICAAIFSVRFLLLVPLSPTFAIEVIWIVLFVNAFNLIDGLDGLAVSFAIIIFIWIVLFGNPHAFSYAVLGVCIGFLPYNIRSASLYLGDSGSHLLGSAIAVLVLPSEISGNRIPFYYCTDFLPLLYPVSDILFVSATRTLRRISILTSGTDHIAHRLARIAGETKSVFILLGITCSFILISLYCTEAAERNNYVVILIIVSVGMTSLFWLQRKTRIFFITKLLS